MSDKSEGTEMVSHSPPTRSNDAFHLIQHMLDTADELVNGSPSIYRPHMREEMRLADSRIARRSIGRPCRNGLGENEKVFLVVGATGAGKSSLINGMVNYILGVEWKDSSRFKIITEDKMSQADSQTKDITAYTFHPMYGSSIQYTFTVIDTPGFGATEGLKRDKQITEQIREFFSISPPEGIDHLNGIGFVIQASQARLTPTQKYIFDSILSIFGKDVSQNIFLMFTFADGQSPPVLEAIKKAEIPSQSDRYFKFNNSGLFAKIDTEPKEDETHFDEMFWKMGLSSFKKFFVEFPKTESVSLRLTKEVLDEREQLHMSLEGLYDQIKFGLDKIEEMRQEELVLQQHEKEIEANKTFTFTVQVSKPTYFSLEGTGQHTTTCVPCNNTCHKNCKIPDDGRKIKCWAMGKGNKCRICKCIWSEHKNLPYLVEHKVVTEESSLESLKEKYHKALKEKATPKKMITSVDESLQKVHEQVLTMIKQAQQSVRRLDEIALKPNPLTEVQYIEVLIDSEKRSTNPGWQQRINYYEEAKRQAVILSKVKDEKESQNLIQQLGMGSTWYSRFKFR